MTVARMNFGSLATAQIDDFLIDRHEITNEEYKRFVDAGGYQRPEFWKQPFLEDGKLIAWDDAMRQLRDATGRSGPATWEAGTYPNGLAQYPVGGVSWYEAAAYAEFVERQLPTTFHWTQASQNTLPIIAASGNFRGAGSQEVGRPETLSGYGTSDMAGNVKEWCFNEGEEGRRFIMGGGFGESAYMFTDADEQSPWRRRPNYGFRTVLLDAAPSAQALAKIERPAQISTQKPVSEEVFGAFRSLYAYDHTDLNARIEETESTESWTREKVTFDAAYSHERVIAHVFVPRRASPPLQSVIYVPGGFAVQDDQLDLTVLEDSLDYLMKSGRVLIAPIYAGTYERRDHTQGRTSLNIGLPQAFYRDHIIMIAKDLRRSLDYLESRRDMDATKIGYMGVSFGAQLAPVFLAVEPRIKAAILDSGGLVLRHDLPEIDRVNFAPRVRTPVLMLNGRFDTSFPLESSQLPLFRLLGTAPADKKHVLFDAGHGNFPYRERVRDALDWFDKYLGPVQR